MLGYLWRSIREQPLAGLVVISAVGFAALLSSPVGTLLPDVCGSLVGIRMSDIPVLAGQGNWPWLFLASWTIMVIAMMPPLLAMSATHVIRSRIIRERARGLAAFAIGYGVVWFAAGIPITIAVIATATLLAMPWAAVAAFLVAFIYRKSPLGGRAHNRCHKVSRIGAFGAAADVECLFYGLRTGLACLAACWPWTLAVMLVGTGHAASMFFVTIYLFLDRLQPPSRVGWRLPPALIGMFGKWTPTPK